MAKNALALFVIVVAIISLVMMFGKKSTQESMVVGPRETSPAVSTIPSTRPQTTFASDSATASAEVTPDVTHLALPTVPANEEMQNQLDQVAFVLRDYRLAMSQNPTGTNAEITSALLGNNLKQTRFPLPEGSSVIEQQLCDRWGVPYFFHQLDALTMEVRSAGPDKQLWTADDVIAR